MDWSLVLVLTKIVLAAAGAGYVVYSFLKHRTKRGAGGFAIVALLIVDVAPHALTATEELVRVVTGRERPEIVDVLVQREGRSLLPSMPPEIRSGTRRSRGRSLLRR